MSKLIGLTIPERGKPGKGSFDIRARKLEQWIASLPMANLGETARRVYNALVETNSLDLSWAERSRFLEAMLQPVNYVTNGMRKHFVGATFPLPEKNRKVAAVTGKIFGEMATAYAIAAEDLLAHNLIFPDSRQLTLFIHRAVSMMGRCMLTRYQTYSPCEDDSWRELHRLFAYARKRRLNHAAVMDPLRDQAKKSSIEDEYKRILLMSLSSPYCLRHGEINKIYSSLERWVNHARLVPLTESREDAAGFLVCSDDEQPPRHLSPDNLPGDTSACYLLDTRMLTEVVREEIQRADKVVVSTLTGIDMQRPDMSHALLRRLLMTWTNHPRRVFSRSRRQSNVQLAIGLSAAHHIIAGAGKQQGSSSRRQDNYFQPAHFDASAVGRTPPASRPADVWDMIYPGSNSPQPGPPPESLAPSTIAEAQTSPPQHTAYWNILNEGAGGYCLESSDMTDGGVQVGELVGVRRNGDGHTWKWGIGVVRWIRSSTADPTNSPRITLGIEMLTPDAAAAGVRIAGEAPDAFQRTLMLPELPAINKPATLVTPPVPYREGSKVTVRILGKLMQVQLTRQVENTGLFAQFQFEVLTTRHDAEGVETEAAGGEPDFASIWSSI